MCDCAVLASAAPGRVLIYPWKMESEQNRPGLQPPLLALVGTGALRTALWQGHHGRSERAACGAWTGTAPALAHQSPLRNTFKRGVWGLRWGGLSHLASHFLHLCLLLRTPGVRPAPLKGQEPGGYPLGIGSVHQRQP